MNYHALFATKKNAPKQVTVYLFLFCLAMLLVRLFLRGQLLELDEAEQVVIAQHFFLGYPNQPPLYSWLQFAVFQLIGVNLLSLAVLKYALLFGCLYYYHQICRLHCHNVNIAWCATLAWALIPAISLDLLKDNTHSILALLSSCITWYWFTTPSRLSKTLWYSRLGIIIGIGLLSKFNYLIFLLTLLISALTIKEYRNKLFNWHLLITIIFAILIALPYAYWLMNNALFGLHSAYKLTQAPKTLSRGFFGLTLAILFFAAPGFIFYRLFFSMRTWGIKPLLNDLLTRYHLICLPVLGVIVLIAGIQNFETRWLIPILFLCPLLFFSQIKQNDNLKTRSKYFIIFCLIVQFIIVNILIYRSHFGHHKRYTFPLDKIVNSVKNQYKEVNYIISDSHWLLGNMQLQFLNSQVYWVFSPPTTSFLTNRLLVVWEGDEQPIWATVVIKTVNLSHIELAKYSENGRIIASQAYLF